MMSFEYDPRSSQGLSLIQGTHHSHWTVAHHRPTFYQGLLFALESFLLVPGTPVFAFLGCSIA